MKNSNKTIFSLVFALFLLVSLPGISSAGEINESSGTIIPYNIPMTTLYSDNDGAYPMDGLFYMAMTGYGGYAFRTDTGIAGFGFGLGFMMIYVELGLSFYPGIDKEKIGSFLGLDSDGSALSIDFGIYYTQNRATLGGGIKSFSLSEETVYTSEESESSSDTVRKSQAVPFITAWYDAYQFTGYMSQFYFRFGYRCDIYPGNYKGFFTRDAKIPSGNFTTHSLMVGIMWAIDYMAI